MINITLALSLCIIYTHRQTDRLVINITLALSLCLIYTDTQTDGCTHILVINITLTLTLHNPCSNPLHHLHTQTDRHTQTH